MIFDKGRACADPGLRATPRDCPYKFLSPDSEMPDKAPIQMFERNFVSFYICLEATAFSHIRKSLHAQGNPV